MEARAYGYATSPFTWPVRAAAQFARDMAALVMLIVGPEDGNEYVLSPER
jgi:hypothetical protein